MPLAGRDATLVIMGYRTRRRQSWQSSDSRDAVNDQGDYDGAGFDGSGYEPSGGQDAYADYEGYSPGDDYSRGGGYQPAGQQGYDNDDWYSGQDEWYRNDPGYQGDQGYGEQGYAPADQGYVADQGYGAEQGYHGRSGELAPLDADRDPVRGYPPSPQQPEPVYPDTFVPTAGAQRALPAGPSRLDAPTRYGAAPELGAPELGAPELGAPGAGTPPQHDATAQYGTVSPRPQDPPPYTGPVTGAFIAQYDDDFDSGPFAGAPGGPFAGAPGAQFASAPTAEVDVHSAPYTGQQAAIPDDFPRRDSGDFGERNPYRDGRRRRGRKSKVVLLSASAAIVVVALAVVAYAVVFKSKSNGSPTSSTSIGKLPAPGSTAEAAASCTAHLGKYCHIETRALDPTPLTLTELFPPQFMNTSDGNSFQEIVAKLDKHCSNGVVGSDLESALQGGRCTQLLRASYVSGNKQIMGTIGVANLDYTNAAQKAGKQVGGNDFITPLTSKNGVTSKLGEGTGVVQAEYKGHYLILVWAEFANLDTPSTQAQRRQLEQFEADLVAGTANLNLSERMVTGKPTSSG